MTARQPCGVVHRADGTAEPIGFVEVPGSGGRDWRAVDDQGQPVKLRPGDHVSITDRVPGHCYLLADKISGRRPYVSVAEQKARRDLPRPRVTIEPAVA